MSNKELKLSLAGYTDFIAQPHIAHTLLDAVLFGDISPCKSEYVDGKYQYTRNYSDQRFSLELVDVVCDGTAEANKRAYEIRRDVQEKDRQINELLEELRQQRLAHGQLVEDYDSMATRLKTIEGALATQQERTPTPSTDGGNSED